MTDLEFQALADTLLRAVEARCDAINDTTDADIDTQRSGNMLTLTFADRSQVVINLQRPLHEVWLAARGGGYHFRHDGSTWRDTRDGTPFATRLSESASQHAGFALAF